MEPPGEPLSLATRNCKVLVPSDYKFECADHDMGTKASLTPSVIFDINAPEQNKLSNFCKGKVHVLLKENFIEPSNAIRHVSESWKVIGEINQPFVCLQGK